MRSSKELQSPLDQFLTILQEKHPRAMGIASDRILTGGSLIDSTSHKPKGISKSCARAALIMVNYLSYQLGVEVTLTSHEKKLLNSTKKFS